MANALFDPGREGILDRTIDMTAATVKAQLLRGYAFSGSDKFLSDITGAGGVLIGAAVALTGKSYSGGVLDAADLTFSAVASGAAATAILLFNDTGSAATSRLIGFIDGATGLPVTPNGGDINVTWDNGANKIFKL